MAVVEVYQTLKYRANNQQVLKEGPYKCTQDNAWLGHGYYFWEDSLRPAKYWGKLFCDNKYIVCGGLLDINEKNCLDFIGNIKHEEFVLNAISQIKELGELTENFTIPWLIHTLQKIGSFPFYAARADTTDAFDPKHYLTEEDFKEEIIFNKKHSKSIVRLNRVFQICIYDLNEVDFALIDIVFEHH